jgi:hypothetical protein
VIAPDSIPEAPNHSKRNSTGEIVGRSARGSAIACDAQGDDVAFGDRADPDLHLALASVPAVVGSQGPF